MQNDLEILQQVPDFREFAEIYYHSFQGATDRAILVNFPNEEEARWLPLSQIDFDLSGTTPTIWIKRWLARKLGLRGRRPRHLRGGS